VDYSQAFNIFSDIEIVVYSEIQKKLIGWLVLQRNLQGLTQVQLSNLLQKNQSFVSKYENCGRKLDIVEFLEICSLLNCNPNTEIQGVLDAIKAK
jgi:transcriptional regulator with XRE-family HTH domain